MRKVIAVLGMCAAVIALSGCVRGAILLDPKFTPPPCAYEQYGTEPYPVAILAKLPSPPTCDLAGAYLVLPNGQQFEVPERGISSGLYDPSLSDGKIPLDYSWDNIAQYGVVVSFKRGNNPRQWWGSKAGIAVEKQAGGYN